MDCVWAHTQEDKVLLLKINISRPCYTHFLLHFLSIIKLPLVSN